MWNIDEAIAYYRDQGAPGDQQMLIALLREIPALIDEDMPQQLLVSAFRKFRR